MASPPTGVARHLKPNRTVMRRHAPIAAQSSLFSCTGALSKDDANQAEGTLRLLTTCNRWISFWGAGGSAESAITILFLYFPSRRVRFTVLLIFEPRPVRSSGAPQVRYRGNGTSPRTEVPQRSDSVLL